MSPDEATRLMAVAKTLKVRVVLALGYGCALRAIEVVRLRVGEIDSAQGIIRVVQGKGRKDRNVMLSEVLALLTGDDQIIAATGAPFTLSRRGPISVRTWGAILEGHDSHR
jgi:integrase